MTATLMMILMASLIRCARARAVELNANAMAEEL